MLNALIARKNIDFPAFTYLSTINSQHCELWIAVKLLVSGSPEWNTCYSVAYRISEYRLTVAYRITSFWPSILLTTLMKNDGPFHTRESDQVLVQTFVISCLDCCLASQAGKYSGQPLQLIQHTASCILFNLYHYFLLFCIIMRSLQYVDKSDNLGPINRFSLWTLGSLYKTLWKLLSKLFDNTVLPRSVT